MFKVVQMHIFVETMIFKDVLINREIKRMAFIWNLFCNNVKVLLLLYCQFNESLLNKRINYWPQTNGSVSDSNQDVKASTKVHIYHLHIANGKLAIKSI